MVLNIKQNLNIRNKNYIRIINRMIQVYIKNPISKLDLEDLPIKKLPKNLKYVNGYLDISFTKITELPKGLIINGNLYISDSNISELPDDIIINGDLWCWGTLLNEKYSKIEIRKKYNIKGDIYGNFKD